MKDEVISTEHEFLELLDEELWQTALNAQNGCQMSRMHLRGEAKMIQHKKDRVRCGVDLVPR
eukprot:2561992-Amphidinium_carterae.1